MGIYQPPPEKAMSASVFFVSVVLFTCTVIASNYLVAFPIGETHITYGALTYPVSFLILDVLSEKHNRQAVLKALRYGLLCAFIPSCLIAFISSEPDLAVRIAIASVSAFFVSQFLDVVIFYRLKQRYPSLWWLRNSVSTCIAQSIDTFIFFNIAFLGILPYWDVILMFLSDYSIKIFMTFLGMPVFYFIAIRGYQVLSKDSLAH